MEIFLGQPAENVSADRQYGDASEAGKTRQHFFGCCDLAGGIGQSVMLSIPALGVHKILYVLLQTQEYK